MQLFDLKIKASTHFDGTVTCLRQSAVQYVGVYTSTEYCSNDSKYPEISLHFCTHSSLVSKSVNTILECLHVLSCDIEYLSKYPKFKLYNV